MIKQIRMLKPLVLSGYGDAAATLLVADSNVTLEAQVHPLLGAGVRIVAKGRTGAVSNAWVPMGNIYQVELVPDAPKAKG
jgi:hypothetical protein